MSTLTANQEASLQLFMQRLQELLASSVVKSQKKTLAVMSETVFGGKPETTVVFDGYDEEAFVAFFTSFRQFTMPKEKAVYFKDVCQIVLDNCGRPELEAWVNVALKRWENLLAAPPIVQFNLDGETYSNDKLMKLWLYGGRFHTDFDKADRWNALSEMARKDAELSVQAMTPKLLNCLVIVGSVIRWWLEAPSESVPHAPAV